MTTAPDPKDAVGVHEYIYRAMSQVAESLKGNRILDAGCGHTVKANWVRAVGAKGLWFLGDLFDGEEYDYETFDIRPECMAKTTGDLEMLLHYYEEESFDAVLCFEVLEHTLNPDSVLRNIYDVLKDGGYLFISVPFTMGHHTPRDLWRWTEDGLRVLLLTHNFEVVKMVPLGGTVGREWSWLAMCRKLDNDSIDAVQELSKYDQL